MKISLDKLANSSPEEEPGKKKLGFLTRKSKASAPVKKVTSSKETGANNKRAAELRVGKNVYRKQVATKFMTLFLYVFFALLAVYLCFALTLMRVIPSTSPGAAFIPTKNLTAPGGLAPVGQQLVVNTKDPQGGDMLSRAKQALLPNHNVAVVEVLGGPFGRVQWTEKGIASVNGKPLAYLLVTPPEKEYLNNQYVVKCINGACEPDTAFIVSSKNIYGQPLN